MIGVCGLLQSQLWRNGFLESPDLTPCSVSPVLGREWDFGTIIISDHVEDWHSYGPFWGPVVEYGPLG